MNCLYKKNINNTKIEPSNKKICAICLSDDLKLVNYPCDTCKNNSWHICKDCLNQCKKRENKCPVCRTEVIEIVIHYQPEELVIHIDSDENQKCRPGEICHIIHFGFNILSYFLGCILIGMIVPTSICYGNSSQDNILCPIFGLLCGIVFCIMVAICFKSKDDINEPVRCLIGFIGAILFVFTISIKGNFYLNYDSFLWLILILPICCFASLRSFVF